MSFWCNLLGCACPSSATPLSPVKIKSGYTVYNLDLPALSGVCYEIISISWSVEDIPGAPQGANYQYLKGVVNGESVVLASFISEVVDLNDPQKQRPLNYTCQVGVICDEGTPITHESNGTWGVTKCILRYREVRV